MKMMKKALQFCLAGVLTLSLAACGGGEKTSKDVLAQAMKQSEKITSMNAIMDIQMEMVVAANGEEQTTATSSTMDISMVMDPMKMRMEMNIKADGLSQDMSMYVMEEDGALMLYMSDGTNWYKQSVSEEELGQYDAMENYQLYLDSSTDLKEVGSEEINGVDTFKYTGSISGDDLREVMESSGSMSSFDQLVSLGMDESKIDEIMAGLGSMEILVWIDKESCYPVRYEMDMGKMMDEMMVGILDAMGDQVSGLSMRVPLAKIIMDCSDFNKVEDFQLPAEALDATLMG